MTYRYPLLSDVAAFVDTHGDETWLRAPALEECYASCSHGHGTLVEYGSMRVELADWEPCEPCIRAAMIDRVWELFEESRIDWDSGNTYLEMTS